MLARLLLTAAFLVAPLAGAAPRCASVFENAGPQSLLDWRKSPVVYGISPYYASRESEESPFVLIRHRLPEIAELGANILWLQPITIPFEEGQGYDVVDDRALWPKLGSESDFRALVQEAHRLNMRVLLDVVPNHTSREHPDVKDIGKNGPDSSAYPLYQHEVAPNRPYNRFLQKQDVNGQTFYAYFWGELLNRDVANPAARAQFTESLAHWVREFDVDGFRFDAGWGPSARWPKFYREVTTALRKLKPELLFLAEDKVSYPAEYRKTGHPHLRGSGIDWAYDWNPKDTEASSKWSFAIDDDPTVTAFNHPDPGSATIAFDRGIRRNLRTGTVKPFRYLENNDTPSISLAHSRIQMRFAAAALFTLPGVPLVFHGQEIAAEWKQWELPSFEATTAMKDFDQATWTFYRDLIHWRRSSSVMSEGSIEELKIVNGSSVTFVRRLGNHHSKVEINFERQTVKVDGHLLNPEVADTSAANDQTLDR